MNGDHRISCYSSTGSDIKLVDLLASHYLLLSCCRTTFLSFSCHYIRRGSTEIDQETHIMRSTVVKRDTASRKRYGSSRAEINMEMNMKPSTLVQDNASMLYFGNEEDKRGCQHVFKSNSTSSRRVQEAYNICLKNGTPRS